MAETTTLLLVDDDMDDQDLFKSALDKVPGNIVCHTANNGQEALMQLMKGTVPDLIFLDMNMPIMNGLATLKAIRTNETLAGIPVMMYSTTAILKDVEEAKALGALRFITKPSKFSELCLLLTTILTGDLR